MKNKYSDGSASAYAELPIEVAYLKWTRGNAALAAIAKEDPGAYLGGWSAFVKSISRNGEESVDLPKLPLPVVTRTSQDGKHPFQVYAYNYVSFFPIAHRTRFELREKGKDANTGRDIERVVAISSERRQGYAPYRQVFGFVFGKGDGDKFPAVLKVWKWSAFITFERAGQQWNKIVVPDGKGLIRRYGTQGEKADGVTVPKFETYGQGHSTPIEAVGLSQPRFIDITPEIDSLWEQAQAWVKCERWNAEGKVLEGEDDEIKSAVQKEFESRCADIPLSNIEVAQLLAENGGDYTQALAALTGDAINQALEEAQDDPFAS
jgi:hypothetical protein